MEGKKNPQDPFPELRDVLHNLRRTPYVVDHGDGTADMVLPFRYFKGEGGTDGQEEVPVPPEMDLGKFLPVRREAIEGQERLATCWQCGLKGIPVSPEAFAVQRFIRLLVGGPGFTVDATCPKCSSVLSFTGAGEPVRHDPAKVEEFHRQGAAEFHRLSREEQLAFVEDTMREMEGADA